MHSKNVSSIILQHTMNTNKKNSIISFIFIFILIYVLHTELFLSDKSFFYLFLSDIGFTYRFFLSGSGDKSFALEPKTGPFIEFSCTRTNTIKMLPQIYHQ